MKTAGLGILIGASMLVASLDVAAAQTMTPQVWDGIVVPTNSAECSGSEPMGWPATYRPYISDDISGASQPSQMVVFSDGFWKSVGLRLANTSAGQFSGNTDKTASFQFNNSDVDDETKSSTGSSTRVVHFVQSPNKVTAATRYIKITGTVTNSGGPGLFCASSIVAVFVRRPH
jgi:hypothetical protein